jgi:hypothetical protein
LGLYIAGWKTAKRNCDWLDAADRRGHRTYAEVTQGRPRRSGWADQVAYADQVMQEPSYSTGQKGAGVDQRGCENRDSRRTRRRTGPEGARQQQCGRLTDGAISPDHPDFL